MNRNLLALAIITVTAALGCTKKDDAKTSGAPAGVQPHVASSCPVKAVGFYKAEDPQGHEKDRYFSLRQDEEKQVLIINRSPSRVRDDRTDTPVNGEKKMFGEKAYVIATCSEGAIKTETLNEEGILSWTTIAFEGEYASVQVKENGKEAAPAMRYKLQPDLSELPMPGPADGALDKYGCPQLIGKYAVDSYDDIPQKYLEFGRTDAGTLTIVASKNTAVYPAIEMNHAAKSDGLGGTLTGECENGTMRIVNEYVTGETTVHELKKGSDKTLDMKKFVKGKLVKTYRYNRIR